MLLLSSCGKSKNTNKDSESSEAHSSENASSEVVRPSEPPSSQAIISEPESSEPIEPAVASLINVEEIVITDVSELENEKKGWGQGHPVDENNRPLTCDQYQPKYGEYGGLFIMPLSEEGDTEGKKMYLTFDEGYENGYTTVILDALKEKECPAVFFVTLSYAKKNPELIKRMVDEGHVVGNHSVNHKSTPTLSVAEQVKEIVDLHNYMVENYNYQMTLFRPPMGEWSTQSLEIARQIGYKSVFWSYAYLDYDVNKQMGVDAAFPKVTGAAHDGAIYLLHAVSKDNAEMLPDVIDNFRENGYSLEALS